MNVRTQSTGLENGDRIRRIFTCCESHPVITLVLLQVAMLVALFHRFFFADVMLISHDVIDLSVFFHSFLREHLLQDFSVPLWNPLHRCGLPFVDAIQGGAFYPLTIISLIEPIPRWIGFNFILHYFMAGLFAYSAARTIGLDAIPSIFAGLVYGFSPTLVSWVLPGHDGKLYVAAWFPLAICLVERLRKSPSFITAGLLGIIFAVSVLTPHLQAVYYVFLCILAYAVMQTVVELYRRRTFSRVWCFPAFLTLAFVIGLSISSVQWLPSYRQIVSYSSRAATERGPSFSSTFSLGAEELISIALPQFNGVDLPRAERAYWGENSFKDNSEAIGFLPCLLALVAFVLPGFRRQKLIWGITAVAVVVYAMGDLTPIFRWLVAVMPLFDRMRAPSTAMFIAVFAIALLSGICLQSLKELISRDSTQHLRRARYVAYGSLVVLSLVALVSVLGAEQLLRLYAQFVRPEILPGSQSSPDKWVRALNNLPAIRAGLWIACVMAAGVAWALSVKSTHAVQMASCGLIVLLLGGNFLFEHRFIHTTDYTGIYGDGPIPQYLRTNQGFDRTIAYGIPTRWFRLGYHRIYSPAGEQDKAMRGFTDLVGGRSAGHLSDSRVVNLTGTRYLIARASSPPSDTALGKLSLRQSLTDAGWTILDNPNSLPRAYLVFRSRQFDSLPALYDAVWHSADSLRRIVYLEGEPGIVLPSKPQPDSMTSTEIKFYSVDSIGIAVSCSTSSILVLTDSYHPNWKAYIDGAPTAVMRAYGAFRAVAVPPRSRLVVFRYEDRLHKITAIVSSVVLLLTLTMVGIIGFHRRQVPPVDHQ